MYKPANDFYIQLEQLSDATAELRHTDRKGNVLAFPPGFSLVDSTHEKIVRLARGGVYIISWVSSYELRLNESVLVRSKDERGHVVEI